MSKDKQKPPEVSSSETLTDPALNQPGIPESPEVPNQMGGELSGAPPALPNVGAAAENKKEPVMPSKLTVDQYLKRSPQGEGISDLIRSLYKTKIMSFGEWETTVKTLLKKHIK